MLPAALILGTAAALPWSWHPSLWTDEAATISASTRPPSELLAMAGNIDAVHATYYSVMHLWLMVVPADGFYLRFPSAVFAGGTAALVLAIARRLGDLRSAILAAAVFALLPRTTWMGIEARPFALSALLAAAATWVLVVTTEEWQRNRGCEGGRPRWWRTAGWLAAYAALIGLGVAVNVYVGLLLVSHGLTLLWLRDVTWRCRLTWVAAAVVGVLLASPVVWTAVHQTGQLGGGDFGWLRWGRNVVVNQWFLGETPTGTSGRGGSSSAGLGGLWRWSASVLAVVAWALVVRGVLRTGSSPVLRWALPWIAVPTLVIGLYSVLLENMYSARYFTFATAGLALLLGQGLGTLARRRALVSAAVVIGLLSAPIYISQRQLYAKSSSDWSSVAAFVAGHKEAGDGVYFSPRYPLDEPTVRQTARGMAVAYPRAFAGLTDVTLLRTPVETDDLTGRSLRLEDAASRLVGLDTVWLVRRRDYPLAPQDDEVLVRHGFGEALRWSGPLNDVVQYRRMDS